MTIPFDPALHTPDVSHWEGVIDFDLFRPRRIVTKLTEGRNFGDPLAGYNLRQAREVTPAIPAEAFHFVATWDDPGAQIEVFAAALWGAYAEGDPAWLDLEGRSLSRVWRALGFVRIRKKLKPFVLTLWREALAQLANPQGFYVGASFWNTYVGPVDWKAEGLPVPRLWAPDYGRDGEGGGIAEPRWIDLKTWPRSWARWQFTDKGKAPGVAGALDLNRDRNVE
jgi:GH25 family lysozyme M1 (1,4-beta-N-acetylmuramidase)